MSALYKPRAVPLICMAATLQILKKYIFQEVHIADEALPLGVTCETTLFSAAYQEL